MASKNSDKRARQLRAEQMRKERERGDAKRRNLLTVGIVVIVVVLIAVAGWAIKSQVDANNAPSETPSAVTDNFGVVFDQEAATGKPAEADGDPVSVVLYEDFQCPACQAFEASSGDFLTKTVEDGTITIEYRPLAFLNTSGNDDYSTRAANAALCVNEDAGAGAFHQMHDLLYDNQPEEGGTGLPDSDLKGFAEQAGASSDVDSCIDSGVYADWVEEGNDEGFTTKDSEGTQVSSTPTVWINGKATDARTPTDLQAAIAAAAN